LRFSSVFVVRRTSNIAFGKLWKVPSCSPLPSRLRAHRRRYAVRLASFAVAARWALWLLSAPAQRFPQFFFERGLDGFEDSAAQLGLNVLAKAEHLRLPRGSFRHGVALRPPLRRFLLSTRKVTLFLCHRGSGCTQVFLVVIVPAVESLLHMQFIMSVEERLTPPACVDRPGNEPSRGRLLPPR